MPHADAPPALASPARPSPSGPRRPTKALLSPLALVIGTLLAACGGGDDDNAEPTPSSLTLEVVGRYANPAVDEAQEVTAAEIPAYDARSKRLFVVNAGLGDVDVLDLSNPAAPVRIGGLDVGAIGASANSVATHDGLVAVAVEATDKTAPGTVALYDAATLALLGQAPVGALPDMLTFTPDGTTLLVANEGEPNAGYTVDPEGSISLVDVRDPRAPVVRTAGFGAFNGRADALRAAGVRLFGPGASVAQDLEPEYITVADDGRTAWATLQENNALARIDLASATVTDILPLGYKDHAVAGQGLDPSDRDAGVAIANWPVFGMYQPDAIASYSVGGQTYLVTANEGDARDYDGFAEESRVKDLTLDPAVFTDALCGGPCADDARLGRLNVTTTLGAGPNGYTALYAFGARSFSIRNAADGSLVYDSGDEFEQRTRELPNVPFNAGHAAADTSLDNRSDNKGPEPEGVVVARFGAKTFAFIALERVGGVMAYDITTPTQPSFVSYLNSRDQGSGDRGPEGMAFIPAAESPNGRPLLVVGNEVSGTTVVHEVKLQY